MATECHRVFRMTADRWSLDAHLSLLSTTRWDLGVLPLIATDDH